MNVTVTTLAGRWKPGQEDGAPGTARFHGPAAILATAAGVYVADTANHRIRLVALDGTVTTLAGTCSGDADGGAHAAAFDGPLGLALDAAGALLIADAGNDWIRRLRFGPAVAADPSPGRPSDVVLAYDHTPGQATRHCPGPATPRLERWEACVGRRIRLVSDARFDSAITIHFDDAWILIEGMGDDPWPYFKDEQGGQDFHLDPSHVVGRTIVRLEVVYAQTGGMCESLAFTFDDGSRQWLEPHYGDGLRIS